MAIKIIIGKCLIEKILSQILIYYTLNKPNFAKQTAKNKQTNKKQNPEDQTEKHYPKYVYQNVFSDHLG